MPIDLVIESGRLAEAGGCYMTVCASWPDYRELWVPGVRELGLQFFQDLVDLGHLDINVCNKAQVLEELFPLSEWMNSETRLAANRKNDGEFAASRIDDIVGLIERYVDAECTSAWIG